MKTYMVTVPVTVFCTFPVQAESEDDALDVPVNLGSLFYTSAGGGIAVKRGCSFSGVENDNATWEKSEVTEA